jgi:peptide/nickel transport system permease protein
MHWSTRGLKLVVEVLEASMNLKSLKEILRYPSALAGAIIILILVAISIYTVITIPYNKAITLWRGAEADWYRNPKLAGPVWFNWFRGENEKLPETLDLTVDSPGVIKKEQVAGSTTILNYTFSIPYNYNIFIDDFVIYFYSNYQVKAPFISLSWITPDGTKTRLTNFAVQGTSYAYRPALDNALAQKLDGVAPEIALFAGPKFDSKTPIKGTYQLLIEGATFEKDSTYKPEVLLYGKLAGWAGTDNLRRDIGLALLWGTPIALIFGLLAAVGTSLSQLIIAAVSTWFGGWVDTLIQRITEVNLVLPFLPILIMVGTLYNRSLPVILICVILLSLFGQGVKTYRAVFLQVKESPYIEAARSYGASNVRIIFSYMIPRLIPLLIPQFITQVPGYVFLEASLAVLGLGDPSLPTWGKLIDDAYVYGALFQGWYYWVLEPSVLLMVTGLAFASVGYALDRIFNPRLRGQ